MKKGQEERQGERRAQKRGLFNVRISSTNNCPVFLLHSGHFLPSNHLTNKQKEQRESDKWRIEMNGE